LYGRGNWRKIKEIAEVRLSDGSVRLCEIHWFEAHGIGKRNIKVKHQQFPAKFDNIAATTPFLKKAVRKPKFKALVQQGLGT
jgi:hypothetical protein